MRAVTRSALAVAAVGSLSAALLPSVAVAVDSAGTPDARDRVAQRDSNYRKDNLPNPLAEKQLALRQKAINMVLRGNATVQRNGAGSDVVKVGRGQYVEISREASDTDPDQIFTILAEFGDKRMMEGPNG